MKFIKSSQGDFHLTTHTNDRGIKALFLLVIVFFYYSLVLSILTFFTKDSIHILKELIVLNPLAL